MKTADYHFDLPEELIASYPLETRDSSRLLHYNLESKSVKHASFTDIVNILQPGDILVRNNTKVMPTRFFVRKPESDRFNIEILLTKNLPPRAHMQGLRNEDEGSCGGSNDLKMNERNAADGNVGVNSKDQTLWQAIGKPGKKLKDGAELILKNGSKVIIHRVEDGKVQVEFKSTEEFEQAIVDSSSMPIPPYMNREAEELDKIRYQTVYAQDNSSGVSIAAPTAGLHFTDEIFSQLKAKGIEVFDTTLHVGMGTFLPVKVENLAEHEMHSEYYEVDTEVIRKIVAAKQEGRRVIAIGSTSVRNLESVAAKHIAAGLDLMKGDLDEDLLKGETDIFIYPGAPGFKGFQLIDGMQTNFHLPESTLIMLVAALTGRDEVIRVYEEAIQEKYRFYSYGDTCLFL